MAVLRRRWHGCRQMIKSIASFTGGFAATNGYCVEGPEGAVLIDAPEGAAAWLRQAGIRPQVLCLTHQHYDHVMDAAAVVEWAGCPVWAHSPYSPDLTLASRVRDMGMDLELVEYGVDRLLVDGETAEVCGMEMAVRHVPGHSPDSLVFHLPGDGVVFAGDTLFAGSVGRTDLPGGSWPLLEAGIRRHLLSLDDETKVLSGHGGGTSVGAERRGNPFLAGPVE